MLQEVCSIFKNQMYRLDPDVSAGFCGLHCVRPHRARRFCSHIMNKVKVVPLVLRRSGSNTELLVFKHPSAGIQLVKGSLELGESISDAALRELAEESGIISNELEGSLGSWNSGYEGQVWHFEEIRCNLQLNDNWKFFTHDGGGHWFEFFWHNIQEPPSQDWHPVFQHALAEIKHRIEARVSHLPPLATRSVA
jgi:8-oxo-dGTP pyrophosphatase MutT (NUDIX family)